MDARILVSGEADVAELARLARLDERSIRTLGVEDPVRILETDHLVVLDQIDAVGLQSAERVVELSRRLLLRSAIDLRHQKDLVAVSVAKCLPHSDLAGALVVVPRVVHEVDAAIDGAVHDAKSELLAYGRQAKVPAAEADRGYPFFGFAKNAVLRGWDHGALRHGPRLLVIAVRSADVMPGSSPGLVAHPPARRVASTLSPMQQDRAHRRRERQPRGDFRTRRRREAWER